MFSLEIPREIPSWTIVLAMTMMAVMSYFAKVDMFQLVPFALGLMALVHSVHRTTKNRAYFDLFLSYYMFWGSWAYVHGSSNGYIDMLGPMILLFYSLCIAALRWYKRRGRAKEKVYVWRSDIIITWLWMAVAPSALLLKEPTLEAGATFCFVMLIPLAVGYKPQRLSMIGYRFFLITAIVLTIKKNGFEGLASINSITAGIILVYQVFYFYRDVREELIVRWRDYLIDDAVVELIGLVQHKGIRFDETGFHFATRRLGHKFATADDKYKFEIRDELDMDTKYVIRVNGYPLYLPKRTYAGTDFVVNSEMKMAEFSRIVKDLNYPKYEF